MEKLKEMKEIWHNGVRVSYAPQYASMEDAINWVRKNIKPEFWGEYEVYSPDGYRVSIRKSYGY